MTTQEKVSPVRIRRASSTRRGTNGHANGTVFSKWGWGQAEPAAKPAAFVA